MTTARMAASVVGVSLIAVSMAASAGACFVRRGAETTGILAPASAQRKATARSIVVEGTGRPDGRITPLRRNLFQMATRRDGVPPISTARIVEAPPLVTLPPEAEGPVLTLVGVAERVVEGRSVRTAVVTGAGELWLVQEGDVIAGRYRVERIAGDELEVRDTRGGVIRVYQFR